MSTQSFEARLRAAALAVETALDLCLDAAHPLMRGTPERLRSAMRHGVLNGGKRLRPFLVIETARLFGRAQDEAVTVAAALECIHSYSLVHDDLPAMDDDDLRRGRPTVHKKFDEATAILAGDALLTEAFVVLADPATHADGAIRAGLVAELARASGAAAWSAVK